MASSGMKGTALRLFGDLAPAYDPTVDFATFFQDRYWKRWVAEHLKARAGDLVLDIGCGTMILEERLSRVGCRFVGLDVTEGMLRSGLGKGLEDVALVVNGDAESLPFPDGSFDAVVSCYVPKYVSLEKLARETARVAKPGAVVVLYDFAKPTGVLAPFIEMYIQGGLRIIGAVLKAARKEGSVAFSRLPQIVDGTTWDRRIERVMQDEGFETMNALTLTGGVVFCYRGMKVHRP